MTLASGATSDDDDGDVVAQTTKKACLEHLHTYLDNFNAARIDAIVETLDEQLEVYVDETLMTTGRNTILPSYHIDFDAGKQVAVTKAPHVVVTKELGSSKDQEAVPQCSIAVSLQATLPKDKSSPATTLDVVYTYNTATMKQIRHDISNVKQTGVE